MKQCCKTTGLWSSGAYKTKKNKKSNFLRSEVTFSTFLTQKASPTVTLRYFDRMVFGFVFY